MKDKREFVRDLCTATIAELCKRLSGENNAQQSPDALPPPVLQRIHDEIVTMRDVLDPEVYDPSFPMDLIENWKRCDLFGSLLNLSNEYEQLQVLKPPRNLREMLKFVRKRPAMYFGRKSLISLDIFMYGFETALSIHKINEDYFFNSRHFSHWLVHEHKCDSSCNTMGWARYLTETSSNEDEAFEKFFELYDEYLKLEPRVYRILTQGDITQYSPDNLKLNPWLNGEPLPVKIEIVRLYPKRWCFLKYYYPDKIRIDSELFMASTGAIKSIGWKFGVSSGLWTDPRRSAFTRDKSKKAEG